MKFKVRVVMNLGELAYKLVPDCKNHLFSKEMEISASPFPGMILELDYPVQAIHFNPGTFRISTVTYRERDGAVEVFLEKLEERDVRAFLSQWNFFKQNGWGW